MHAALVHVQAYYCHASLGSRIKIDWKYYWYYPNKSFLATVHTINSLKSTTKSDLGLMDLVVCFIFTFSSLFCFLTHGTLLGPLGPVKNPWDLFRICGTRFGPCKHCAKIQKYNRAKQVSNFLICGANNIQGISQQRLKSSSALVRLFHLY